MALGALCESNDLGAEAGSQHLMCGGRGEVGTEGAQGGKNSEQKGKRGPGTRAAWPPPGVCSQSCAWPAGAENLKKDGEGRDVRRTERS